jgi:hypothetical protein
MNGAAIRDRRAEVEFEYSFVAVGDQRQAPRDAVIGEAVLNRIAGCG